MTVPFIMALGVGVSLSAATATRRTTTLVWWPCAPSAPFWRCSFWASCSAPRTAPIPPVLPEVSDSVELWQLFHVSLPTYLEEIAVSLLPIIVMFGIFQFKTAHGPPVAGPHCGGLRIPTWALCCSSPAQCGLYARR